MTGIQQGMKGLPRPDRDGWKNFSDNGEDGPRFALPVAAVALLFFLALPPGQSVCRAAVFFPRISLVPLATGFARPVQVTHAGDGSGLLYVVEQGGRIRTIRNGSVEPTPFLDISGRVLSGGEQGLLGLAFPPGYAANGRFYVNYTRTPDGATVVARYRAAGTPRVADPTSEEVLLVIGQPFANHNGGQVAFGPDGFLYIGMGDGGSGGDPQNNAQNPATLLGKMLRIDVEAGVQPYAIPPSNPFVGTAGFREEIWAQGLRNPWRFSFDRLTGDLYIGDVGQSAFEEIDFQPAGSPGGENYGWKIMEGSHCFGAAGCDNTGLVPPVAEYDHSQGCSVTGGRVYRGDAVPTLRGVYLYADFCSGRIFGLMPDGPTWRSETLLTVPLSISSFGEDEAGNLYVTDHAGGAVHRITAGNTPPSVPVLVSPVDGQAGLPTTVDFRWNVSVDPDGDPVTYRFFLDTDPSFAGTVPVPVVPTAGTASSSGTWIRFLFPAAALALSGLFRRGWRVRTAVTVLLLFTGLLISSLSSCGGSGGSQAPGTLVVSHQVSGLGTGTAYFWKVAADDGTDSTESATRTFSTAPP